MSSTFTVVEAQLVPPVVVLLSRTVNLKSIVLVTLGKASKSKPLLFPAKMLESSGKILVGLVEGGKDLNNGAIALAAAVAPIKP